ncbi:MAG: rhomboid family intramembrane serine protease [Sphingomonadales bacterium]|nr:rhomboid family intramembrane serine protease [Sphingomonadales bacterium]
MSNSISPGRFEFLPPVVKNIVIINGLCYLGTYVLKTSLGVNLIDVLGMHIPGSKAFAFWQPLTHLFMHGNLEHLLFNMFSFWMFGSILENVWGSSRFLIFYLVAGIGAAFLHYLVVFLKDIRPESLRIEDLNLNIIGASGAVAGIWIAFAFMFPNSYLYLFFFLPVKAKYLAMMYIAFELFAAFEANPADNVAHFAHLGGMFFGFAMVRWFRRVDTNWG